MLRAMGYGWDIARSCAVIALAAAAAGAAEPTEPLTITRLADSESKLLVSATPEAATTPDTGAEDFSQAVNAAVQLQQQSIAAQCKSADRSAGSVAARWAWEARCRYKRY